MDKPPYRILYLNHVAEQGGAETGLFDIVTRLDRRMFQPLVVLPDSGPLAERLAQRGVTVRFLPLRRHNKTLNPFKLLSAYANVADVARRLAVLIRAESIDLIHANSTTAHIYGAWAGHMAGVPAVWHCRDLVALGPLGKWLYRRAARVIAISGVVQASLERYAARTRKTVCIHNGIDVDVYRQSAEGLAVRNEFNLRGDQILIGMVAQMVPWKNHGLFLRAARRIATDFPATMFLLAGADLHGDHPGYRPALEQFVTESGLKERVIFLGFRRDMPRVMAALDVLVHPAACEPFGRVVAEAMAAGKPVVAVDSAGPREIIEPGVSGLLTPPDDVDALAQAMRRLLQDSAWAARLGEAGRRRIEDHFRVDQMTDKIEQLYREVLNTP